MSERRLNHFERHSSNVALLKLPSYHTVEEAENEITVGEGENRRFLLRDRPGTYRVCSAYLVTPRGEPGSTPTPKWTYREEFSFTHGEMTETMRHAAFAVGMELLEDF